MSKNTFDIITIGSAVRDIMFATDQAETIKNPKPDPTKLKLIGFEYGAKIHSDDVQRYYGGGANNTAIGLSRLGLKVAACICVGSDGEGDAMIAHLKTEGVDTRFIQQDKTLLTGLSFLVKETKTNEHVAFVNYGANEHLTIPTKVITAKPTWFYVSALSTKSWSSLMRSVLHSGAAVAWNPGAIQLADQKALLPLLKTVAVLIVNKDEATELAQQAGSTKHLAQAIHRFGPSVVVVTDGRKGATVFDGQKFYVTPGSLAAPKDTTGAGDAFGSSLVAGLVKFNHSITKALRLATINASAEVAQPGAQNGLLTWAQARKKLN